MIEVGDPVAVVFALRGRGQRGLHPHSVVGEQSGGGIAQRGLDGGGLRCGLGLPAQRSQLPIEFAPQIGEAVEVRLQSGELAHRFVLASAVLEHAGGLFDEAAALERIGMEDRVEAALTDDDVHLLAQAGVVEQLLDVQQPGRCPVDGVLGPAGAEQGPGDRDLGVVDGDGSVGVVDGQGHLGAAQCLPLRCAGEDDVVHLPAAQVLRPLLAHHPGQGVDDIGLARSVGSDDAGDARLESECRRRGKGLESPQCQALEMHIDNQHIRRVGEFRNLLVECLLVRRRLRRFPP